MTLYPVTSTADARLQSIEFLVASVVALYDRSTDVIGSLHNEYCYTIIII